MGQQRAPRMVKVVRNTADLEQCHEVLLEPTKAIDFSITAITTAKRQDNYVKFKAELERLQVSKASPQCSPMDQRYSMGEIFDCAANINYLWFAAVTSMTPKNGVRMTVDVSSADGCIAVALLICIESMLLFSCG